MIAVGSAGWVVVAGLETEGSSGVPKPSVFKVSMLLARLRGMLWLERFEGARPKSWRVRLPGRGTSKGFAEVGLEALRCWW